MLVVISAYFITTNVTSELIFMQRYFFDCIVKYVNSPLRAHRFSVNLRATSKLWVSLKLQASSMLRAHKYWAPLCTI